jgi:hypothetical protein
MERNNVHTPEACTQRRTRIRLALAAYAYEFHADPIMSDANFDLLSNTVDVSVETGVPDLDWFFMEEFDPSTGQWIHKHPELDKLKSLYWRLKGGGAFAKDPENPYDI